MTKVCTLLEERPVICYCYDLHPSLRPSYAHKATSISTFAPSTHAIDSSSGGNGRYICDAEYSWLMNIASAQFSRPTTNLVQSGSSMHVSSRRPLHRLTWVLPSIWLGLLECCSTWFLHLPLRVTLADGTTIQSWRHAPPEESVSLLYCEACQFGKHQSFFWSQDRYKSLTSFSVSSFRCRGSFPYVIPFRHSIFYGIVYDYSRITSLYLMKTNIQNCLK